MEHDIPFGNSNRENGPTFLDFPLFWEFSLCLFKNNAYKQYAREQDEIWTVLSHDLRWENKTYKLKRSFGLKSHDNSSRPTTLGQLWNIFADTMSRYI